MDSTSNFDYTCPDSGLDFDMSSINDWTPTAPSSTRKRKHDQSLSKPQFSSTLNESMIESLKEFHLNPNTPEKQHLTSKLVVASPIQETHDILYSELILVKTNRKKLTPKKWKNFYGIRKRESLKVEDILANSVIMENVFQYLSGGDLYRATKVSIKFKCAVINDRSAFHRYLNFMEIHKVNKENYIITPPSSPEKSDSPPHTHNTSNFDNWMEETRYLRGSEQHLTRCSICDKPSLVEYNIVQCRHCGYVRCTNCSSFSRTGPENFKDRCNSAILRLEDSTNLRDLSWFASSPKQDSGIYSGGESPPKVKRALFRGEKKIFGSNSSNRIEVVMTKKKEEKVSGYVSVVQVNQKREIKDCSPSPTQSPPRSMNKVAWQRFKKRLTL